jgi:hypothetical protein
MKLSERLKDELWANLIDEIKQREADSELLNGSDLNLKEYRLEMEKQVKEFEEYIDKLTISSSKTNST